jgi:hypothetical protein
MYDKWYMKYETSYITYHLSYIVLCYPLIELHKTFLEFTLAQREEAYTNSQTLLFTYRLNRRFDTVQQRIYLENHTLNALSAVPSHLYTILDFLRGLCGAIKKNTLLWQVKRFFPFIFYCVDCALYIFVFQLQSKRYFFS